MVRSLTVGQEYSGTLEESTILGPTLMPQFTLPYIDLLLVPPQNPNPSQALRKSPYDTRERDLVKESSVGGLHCLFPSRVPCAPPLPPPTSLHILWAGTHSTGGPSPLPSHVTASDGCCLSAFPGCCEHRLPPPTASPTPVPPT